MLPLIVLPLKTLAKGEAKEDQPKEEAMSLDFIVPAVCLNGLPLRQGLFRAIVI